VHSPATALESLAIESNELKGALLLHEGVLVAKIEPKVGETLATILTEECTMPETNPLRGKLFVKDCLGEAEVHKVKHLIEELKALSELWVGAKNEEHLLTWIEGSAWVKLGGAHSGLAWAGIHNKP
jgi:hypothetical protein